MAIDVTATNNYTEMSSTDQGLADTAIAAIKALYTGVADADQADNAYMIIKEQNESQEGT